MRLGLTIKGEVVELTLASEEQVRAFIYEGVMKVYRKEGNFKPLNSAEEWVDFIYQSVKDSGSKGTVFIT